MIPSISSSSISVLDTTVNGKSGIRTVTGVGAGVEVGGVVGTMDCVVVGASEADGARDAVGIMDFSSVGTMEGASLGTID